MEKDFNSLKALAVDDHENTRSRLVSSLKGFGITVVEAENGIEALDRLREGGIDIILTDIVMPEMDGFELCGEVRRSSDFHSLPIVVLSTHCDTNYIIKALRYGADDYIAKPFDVELVKKVITRVLTPVLKEISDG